MDKDNQSESITALRMLKWFLSAVCATVDRDGWLLVRDPVLRAEVAIPARVLVKLCAEQRRLEGFAPRYILLRA